MKLNLMTKVTTAPMLPTAESRGDTVRSAIRAPMRISATPMTLDSPRSPSDATAQAQIGLFVTSGSMFWLHTP